MSEGSDSGKVFAASPGSKAEFKITDSKSGLPDAFPPEMLAHILSHLSYADLLVVRRVVKQWKAVVNSDFTLGVQMFKKAREVYVEAGDGSSRDDTEPGSEEIRMHPVLSVVSFILGNKVSDAVAYRRNGMNTELAVSGAANDLATIPAVHTFTIKIEEDLDEDFSFQVEVKNTEGVTVIGIFTALAKAAKRSVSTERGPESMADHRYLRTAHKHCVPGPCSQRVCLHV
ncbi:hypothetical protein DFH09DRAFT_1369713 [Mycena vulgaris]|nr:hypothetical protein DFH09DRAFT_1369713 [Mycena vulgaris]